MIRGCGSFTLSLKELANAWDLMKKLSKEDTIIRGSIEKVSTKWKLIFDKTGNWGKDTKPHLLEKKCSVWDIKCFKRFNTNMIATVNLTP